MIEPCCRAHASGWPAGLPCTEGQTWPPSKPRSDKEPDVTDKPADQPEKQPGAGGMPAKQVADLDQLSGVFRTFGALFAGFYQSLIEGKVPAAVADEMVRDVCHQWAAGHFNKPGLPDLFAGTGGKKKD
jgi:hypothetical protein